MNRKLLHFQNRAGFGMPFLQQEKKTDIERQFNSLSATERPLQVVEKPAIENMKGQNDPGEKVKKAIQKTRHETIQLNGAWVRQMAVPGLALREKMCLFWHDHFACRTRIAYLAQQQNNVLRKNAFGSFKDLLINVSKDPAMLQFLNNQQNKKDSPNENFARELMELFTLGRGNYSETDIKNAARAFTGWSFNPLSGQFVFRARVHDTGIKAFRGKHGSFTGEDILSMLLDDKQTARFITRKIWAYFVSTEIRDEEVIASLAADFYQSAYTIEKLMKSIYTSDWFYEARYTGNRIKSPVELLAGILVHTKGTFPEASSPAFVQRALGQLLFFPPNVGGWPQGKQWIDSSSLTFRLSLPGILFGELPADLQAKDDGDVNNPANGIKKSTVSCMADWPVIAHHFVRNRSNTTLEEIEEFLLARPTTKENRKRVKQYASQASSDMEFIKRAYVSYMSLPEYQLS